MATENDAEPGPEAPAPPLFLIQGDASAEEVAALTAVLASLGSAPAAPARRTPEWSAHHRKVRPAYRSGPGAWRSSALPG